MPTFAALSIPRLSQAQHVVLLCLIFKAVKLLLTSRINYYSEGHEAWKLPHVVNVTGAFLLNATTLSKAASTGTWDVAQLIEAEKAASAIADPPDKTAQILIAVALTSFIGYHWNILLERWFPSRPRGTAPAPSARLVVGDEQMEEEVIKKWIASGRVQRSSISWTNTLAKGLLDISFGRAMILLIGSTVRSIMLGMQPVEIVQMWRGDVLLETLAHVFTPTSLTSLASMVVVPASQRVIFAEAVWDACGIFYSVIEGALLPKFLMTGLAKEWAELHTDAIWYSAVSTPPKEL